MATGRRTTTAPCGPLLQKRGKECTRESLRSACISTEPQPSSVYGEIDNMPCVLDSISFHSSPLTWLTKLYDHQLVVLTSDAEHANTREALEGVLLFGPRHIRTVLLDEAVFQTMKSESMRSLSRNGLEPFAKSIFSMTGTQHSHRRELLGKAITAALRSSFPDIIAASDSLIASWSIGSCFSLLGEMRRLALTAMTPLLFGQGSSDRFLVGLQIQRLFSARQAFHAHPNESNARRIQLLAHSASAAIHQALKDARRGHGHAVLDALSRGSDENGRPITSVEVISQVNGLVLASCEPIAVLLSWALLCLSQLPPLVRLMHDEAKRASKDLTSNRRPFSYIDSFIAEVTRLFPPNAIVARTATQDSEIDDVRIKADCGILLSPWAEQRNRQNFSKPASLILGRRLRARCLSSIDLLAFGLGPRFCLGKHVALSVASVILHKILSRFGVQLATEQEIGWRINITFHPYPDPLVQLCSPRTTEMVSWRGPITQIVSLNDWDREVPANRRLRTGYSYSAGHIDR